MKIVAILNKPTKIKKIDYEMITFEDESYLVSSHMQDCCEDNYADFDGINDSTILDHVFENIELEKNEFGFLLNGYLINCYSRQNGYYSADVDIDYYGADHTKLLSMVIDCSELDC